MAAAEAYLRGIERRIAAGLSPDVGSVASLFVSRWDVAVAGKVPAELDMKLGIAIGQQAYKAYGDWLASPRCRRVMNDGAAPQRLLLASTGTKDPKASDMLYVEALAAPFTVNTMPEGTLKALADHGEHRRADAGRRRRLRGRAGRYAPAGIDLDALAARLQKRRCGLVRGVVERADGRDRVEDGGAGGMKVLVIDVGGTHVKILATGQTEERRVESGPTMTAAQMVRGVRALAEGWAYDAVSIGYPGAVRARHAGRPSRTTWAGAGSGSTTPAPSAAR